MEISYLIPDGGKPSFVIKCRSPEQALMQHHGIAAEEIFVSIRADHWRTEHGGECYWQAGEQVYLQYPQADFDARRIPEVQDYGVPVLDFMSPTG